jgi:hypothetical protein
MPRAFSSCASCSLWSFSLRSVRVYTLTRDCSHLPLAILCCFSLTYIWRFAFQNPSLVIAPPGSVRTAKMIISSPQIHDHLDLLDHLEFRAQVHFREISTRERRAICPARKPPSLDSPLITLSPYRRAAARKTPTRPSGFRRLVHVDRSEPSAGDPALSGNR